MSRTEPRVQLHLNGSLTGILRVGNAQYPLSGRRLAGSVNCAAQPPRAPVTRLVLTPAEESTILGGEMTLWSELVTEQQVDLRMWPRGYAIAERLWSAASLTDENSMYARMGAVGEWGTQSVGLLQGWDQAVQFQRLARSAAPQDVTPLQILSEAVEQAQYYLRLHERWMSPDFGYNNTDPLNRFVDALPVESVQVRQLQQQVDAFIATVRHRSRNSDKNKISKVDTASIHDSHVRAGSGAAAAAGV
jgi:hexosaminidase